MKIHIGLRRLRHLSFLARQKKNALQEKLKDTSANLVAAAKTVFKTEVESHIEPEVESGSEIAVQEEGPLFPRFVDLPTELRLNIWKHVAESTTQVVSITPYTTKGLPRRNFKFYGHYRSHTPFPPFLQVNHELRQEGLRHYTNLVEHSSDFTHTVPFNFDRDILLISLQLAYARLLHASLRNMLPPTTWPKVQNICFQVRNWEMYPWHLDILDEMPNLKQLHFTSWRSTQYRQNIDQVLNYKTVKWSVQDCAEMLGRGSWGQVDYDGVDDIDEVWQRPFHFLPLKLEFEFARLYAQPTLTIKLPFWSPRVPLLSNNPTINADTSSDVARADLELSTRSDDG